MKLFLSALNIVSKLPVISTVNRLCGFAIGGAKGIFLVWFIGIILTFFYYNEALQVFFMLLEKSHITAFLYHNNLLFIYGIKNICIKNKKVLTKYFLRVNIFKQCFKKHKKENVMQKIVDFL